MSPPGLVNAAIVTIPMPEEKEVFGQLGGLCRKSLLKGAKACGGGMRDVDLICILSSSILKVFPISHIQLGAGGQGSSLMPFTNISQQTQGKERGQIVGVQHADRNSSARTLPVLFTALFPPLSLSTMQSVTLFAYLFCLLSISLHWSVNSMRSEILFSSFIAVSPEAPKLVSGI